MQLYFFTFNAVWYQSVAVPYTAELRVAGAVLGVNLLCGMQMWLTCLLEERAMWAEKVNFFHCPVRSLEMDIEYQCIHNCKWYHPSGCAVWQGYMITNTNPLVGNTAPLYVAATLFPFGYLFSIIIYRGKISTSSIYDSSSLSMIAKEGADPGTHHILSNG